LTLCASAPFAQAPQANPKAPVHARQVKRLLRPRLVAHLRSCAEGWWMFWRTPVYWSQDSFRWHSLGVITRPAVLIERLVLFGVNMSFIILSLTDPSGFSIAHEVASLTIRFSISTPPIFPRSNNLGNMAFIVCTPSVSYYAKGLCKQNAAPHWSFSHQVIKRELLKFKLGAVYFNFFFMFFLLGENNDEGAFFQRE
jgi:hypothetical protein